MGAAPSAIRRPDLAVFAFAGGRGPKDPRRAMYLRQSLGTSSLPPHSRLGAALRRAPDGRGALGHPPGGAPAGGRGPDGVHSGPLARGRTW
eukprot:382845-Pyramimonas_sp.AAC.1